MIGYRLNFLVVLSLVCVSFPVGATPEKPPAYAHGSSQFGLRFNPTGLRLNNTAGWRMPLSSDQSLLWKTTYLELGGGLIVTPVSLFPSVHVEWVPIAPLVFRAQSSQATYLGVLGHALTFDQAEVDASSRAGAYWNPQVVAERTAGESGSLTTGFDHMISATLQLKFGRVLAKASFEHHWMTMKLPDEAVRWYDSSTNLMMAADDRLSVTKALLAYVAMGSLAGPRFLLVGPSYEFQQTQGDDLRRHLLGFVAAWRPGWMPQQALTLGTVAQRYLVDAAAHRESQILVLAFAQMRFGTPSESQE